jgi:hypothetical protein
MLLKQTVLEEPTPTVKETQLFFSQKYLRTIGEIYFFILIILKRKEKMRKPLVTYRYTLSPTHTKNSFSSPQDYTDH